MPDFSRPLHDTWLLAGARTPWVDYCAALAAVSPTDLGIHAARAAIARSGLAPTAIGASVVASMAHADFDAFVLPRHVGLYAGLDIAAPAIGVQRICGSGFEVLRQAADQIALGYADAVLAVGTESMSRNPICAYTHRSGFRLGAPVEFKDFLWEALDDPAARVSMIQTAENLARQYGIRREAVDAYAARSFERAVHAQAQGWFAEEIAPVTTQRFEREGYHDRGISLPRKITTVDRDTHPKLSPLEVLAGLRTVYDGGVQTAGNSAALVDGAAAMVVASGAVMRDAGRPPLARLAGAAAAGVPPEIMGIGPVPAIRQLLAATGLSLSDIALVEINEAQGAQVLACARALELDESRLNVNGGSIALGHPLAATGLRLTLTAALELQRRGERYAIVSACVGGGQGMALLIENPDFCKA
ncbi:thiolase family protein [Roseateles sp. LKC17W]|uniref:Thiolase family protein n=1 Tax=Pelomonas margarita TaxID=3299031 RepID=A0ABW7FID1_9BURK